MTVSMITTQNAPRDPTALAGEKLHTRYRLGLNLGLFQKGSEQEKAFMMQNEAAQGQELCNALMTMDANGGAAPQPQLQQPQQPQMQQPIQPAGVAPAPQPMQQPALPPPMAAQAPPPVAQQPPPVAQQPPPVAQQPPPMAQPQAQPAAALPPPMQPPVAQPQAQQPGPMQPPPAAQQPPPPMQPPAQPQMQQPPPPIQPPLPAGRQPATQGDPGNTGTQPRPGQLPPAGELAAISKQLKEIKEELDSMPGIAELEELKDLQAGMNRIAYMSFLLMLEMAEERMGMPKETIISMIVALSKNGEVEALLEKADEGKEG